MKPPFNEFISNTRNSINTVAIFSVWFAFLAFIFSTLVHIKADAQSGLQKVIAFGDPKTFVPLAFSFALGIGLKFVLPSKSKLFQVARWIGNFGRDGILVFYSLILGLTIGTWKFALHFILFLTIAILANIVVMAFFEAVESEVKDKMWRILIGVTLLNAVWVIPVSVP